MYLTLDLIVLKGGIDNMAKKELEAIGSVNLNYPEFNSRILRQALATRTGFSNGEGHEASLRKDIQEWAPEWANAYSFGKSRRASGVRRGGMMYEAPVLYMELKERK